MYDLVNNQNSKNCDTLPMMGSEEMFILFKEM